jgi:hypothetical protein
MKSHSIYVEQRTVYMCACGTEFGDIQKAEAHLRHPPVEKTKTLKPKRRAAHRPRPKIVAAAPVGISGESASLGDS